MIRVLVLLAVLALAGTAQAAGNAEAGKRNNPIMKGFAATLSNQDMQDLAAWFASQQSNLHFQR